MEAEEIPTSTDGAADAVPRTGDAAVDAALERLSGVAGLPPREQVALLDEVHQRLQDRLAGSDGGTR